MIVSPHLCYGGAERVAVCLANGFVEAGHEVIMVANLFDPITYSLDDRIIKLNLMKSNANIIKKWLPTFLLLRKYIKEQKPDVILGIMDTVSLIAKIASIGLSVPVVMTEHSCLDWPKYVHCSWLKHFLKFDVKRIHDFVTILTEADRPFVEKYNKNIKVMPNPLALVPVKEVEHKDNVIVAAGRIPVWHYKGFDILIQAWSKIARKYPDWKLEIAGKDDDYKPLVEKTIDNNSSAQIKALTANARMLVKDNEWLINEGRLEFLGFREDIGEVMKHSAIFVLSSRYEGFGLVLIEAMSQGCACIAADYKGRQSEIITSSEEGITIEPENADAMATALEKVISDKEYRERIQQGAIKRSNYYTIENCIKRWEDYLQNVVLHVG